MAGAMRRRDADGDGAISVAEYVGFDHDPAGSRFAPLTDNVRFVADVNYAGTTGWRQTLDVYVPKKASVPGRRTSHAPRRDGREGSRGASSAQKRGGMSSRS